MDSDRAERLRAVARDLWGDAWVLQIEEWADGSRDLRVVHSRGVVETEVGPATERDRLVFDDAGRIVHERRVETKAETVSTELVERDVDGDRERERCVSDA